jgi:uncharacterized protein with HEPN domain
MPPPDTRKFLFDIQKACGLIQQFAAGKSFSDYVQDPLLRSGIERQFEIVGEAISQMLRTAPEVGPRLTGAPRIVAFRNYLIHGYASVSNEVVWTILQDNLPVLAREVGALLSGEVEPAPEDS